MPGGGRRSPVWRAWRQLAGGPVEGSTIGSCALCALRWRAGRTGAAAASRHFGCGRDWQDGELVAQARSLLALAGLSGNACQGLSSYDADGKREGLRALNLMPGSAPRQVDPSDIPRRMTGHQLLGIEPRGLLWRICACVLWARGAGGG